MISNENISYLIIGFFLSYVAYDCIRKDKQIVSKNSFQLYRNVAANAFTSMQLSSRAFLFIFSVKKKQKNIDSKKM